MELLVWIAVGTIAGVSLRFLLARYGLEAPANWEHRRYVHRPDARKDLSPDALPRPDPGPETVTCSQCRTSNDADYDYCRRCVGVLDAG